MAQGPAGVEMDVDLDALQITFQLPRRPQVLSHHPGAEGVWRIRSAGADFAVKVLGPADEWTRARATDQGRLELAAAQAGVGMPEAVHPRSPSVGLCADMSGRLVEVHRWVESLPEGRQIEPVALHQWLGTTLALLHTLLPLPGDGHVDDLAGAYALHPVADWAGWVDEAYQQDLPWAPAGAELLQVIPRATMMIESGLADRTLPRCLTHRDVNPPNILHTAGGPLLCDFAYAGPDIGWLEAVSTAASFEAPDILTSYVAAGGHSGPTTTAALARAVGSAANWLAFNMWLSLGHRNVDEAVRRQATARIPVLCREVLQRVLDPESDCRALFTAMITGPVAPTPLTPNRIPRSHPSREGNR